MVVHAESECVAVCVDWSYRELVTHTYKLQTHISLFYTSLVWVSNEYFSLPRTFLLFIANVGVWVDCLSAIVWICRFNVVWSAK